MNKKESSLLQETYIQKSRIFLLPLTGLLKNKYFRETNTYVSSPDLICDDYPDGISFDDKTLIVSYSKSYKAKQDNIYNQISASFKNISVEETGWDRYENTLMSNRNFVGFHESMDEFIYTFDLSKYPRDWDNFMKGRYSLMTDRAKVMIKEYRWSSLLPIEQRKLYCYLYLNKDESCFKEFADELKISIEMLKEVRELCDKPNLKLETYTCSIKEKMNEA